MRRAAGIASILTGLGFGIPCLIGLLYLRRTGETWTLLGFPTYGDGSFERLGIETTVPLLGGFLIVCVAEIAVGVAILRDGPRARAASTALLPAELIFWIGFALPFGFVLGFGRAALLLRPSPLRERNRGL